MALKDLSTVKYHPVQEKILKILKNKTQNDIESFYRINIAFHLTRMASMMWTKVRTKDRGTLPVNGYMINLAPSGLGKNLSANIIEEQLTNGFRNKFMDETFPKISDKNLAKLAIKTFNVNVLTNAELTQEDELARIQREFEDLGDLPFDYDSGTTPAFKQVRHKCLMARAGALNFCVDEIGDNLLSNSDLLSSYLQSYDKGYIKQKLTKNTSENRRLKEINGTVPSNMLLFGTPAKLLDGSKTEEEFYSMLETGYARRCLFGYSADNANTHQMTPEQIYDLATDTSDINTIAQLDKLFTNLAKEENFSITIGMDKDVNLLLIEYRQQCESIARKLPDHKHIEKAELQHRYFKALKLAGTYAFIDSSAKVEESHLYAAIKLAEDSGIAFKKILTREKPHIRLAKFIGSYDGELTKSDIMEELPSFKGVEAQKKEMLDRATEYGFRNNIIIKEKTTNNITFFTGEMLEDTDLSKINVAYSSHITENYNNTEVPFDQLHKLFTAKNLHYTVHHLNDGYRDSAHVLPGFNLIALDIDDGSTTIDMVKLLLGNYKYILYTTKRHTDEKPRFRLVFPMSHRLKLNRQDYKDFMQNVFNWLPLTIDSATGDYARKWASNRGKYIYNDGELLDVTVFIPKTVEADKLKKSFSNNSNLDNLARWFVTHSDGNRNNMLSRYSFCLVDAGKSISEIQTMVLALNDKLKNPLPQTEVLSTVIVSASAKVQERKDKHE